MSAEFDAVIIGAGPAGSTAAILLARAGWSVALIERQTFPRRKVCGECVAASNLVLLQALGIEDLSIHGSPELRRVALICRQRIIAAELPSASDAGHPWGLALGRETLDVLLLERARACGAVVMQPCSFESISGEPGDFRCRVRAKATRQCLEVRARFAISAGGSRLSSRHRPREPSDLLAFKVNFKHTSLSRGLLPILSFAGGYGGMVMADRGLLTLACCIRADRLCSLRDGNPQRAAGDLVGEMLQRECHGVADVLQGANRVGAWMGCGPIDPGIHLRSGDKVIRIGNAAGEAHPIIGEGISMAIQSAWLLFECILKAGARPEQLHDRALQRKIAAQYADTWRTHFAGRLRIAAAFAHLAMRPRLLSPFLPLLARARGLRHGAVWSGKTRCAVDAAAISWLTSSAMETANEKHV